MLGHDEFTTGALLLNRTRNPISAILQASAPVDSGQKTRVTTVVSDPAALVVATAASAVDLAVITQTAARAREEEAVTREEEEDQDLEVALAVRILALEETRALEAVDLVENRTIVDSERVGARDLDREEVRALVLVAILVLDAVEVAEVIVAF
ncbi:ATP synthase F0, B subunit domain protein [Ancylostoma duodenale]|uniref:ATP synthase F0, B subunit domain protein n=1 Tax=Ancylostoma duodenale TaxID=51022 RepID=A0A0C2GNV3_9BILA|nr:ATP synthase F0, B subunit domain protein [Ancylostoma duodenale]